MIENQTYVITFIPQDLHFALANTDAPPFLYPYYGDVFSTNQDPGTDVIWEPAIQRIMEQFDEAWRELARS